MKDSELMQHILDATKQNAREFSIEIGLSSPQIIYNILHGNNRISKKIARMVSDRYPEVATFYEITSGKTQIGNSGVNIQADKSKISLTDESTVLLKMELKQAKAMIARLEKEVEDYRTRERTYLKLIANETEKS